MSTKEQQYLKKALKTPATGEEDTRERVIEMLRDIEEGGEARVRHYAQTLDGWTGDIIVSHEEIDAATAKVPEQTKQDIRFSSEWVKAFPCFRVPWA
jgi:sulfopropanediol 3-dehydrogenase